MKCKTCGGSGYTQPPHSDVCLSCKGTGIDPEWIGCHKCKYEYKWSTDEPCKSCGDFTKFVPKEGG